MLSVSHGGISEPERETVLITSSYRLMIWEYTLESSQVRSMQAQKLLFLAALGALQDLCTAVCCSVLQCVAVCCSV